MTKKNTERVYLDLSKGQFQRIINWAIKLPRNRSTDDFVILLMDAKEDYLKRVKEKHRLKNPQPKIPKRGAVKEVLDKTY